MKTKLPTLAVALVLGASVAPPAMAAAPATSGHQVAMHTASPLLSGVQVRPRAHYPYADDWRVFHLDALSKALKGATPQQIAKMKPLVVTAPTFLQTPRLFALCTALKSGKLVVVGQHGGMMTTNDSGALSGHVQVPFRAAKTAFADALVHHDKTLEQFLLQHITVDPVSVERYAAMTQDNIGTPSQLGALHRYIAPTGVNLPHDSATAADGPVMYSDADLYAALGGTVTGVVFIGQDTPQRFAVGGPTTGFTYLCRETKRAINDGVFTRVGIKQYVINGLYAGNGMVQTIKQHFDGLGLPVPGTSGAAAGGTTEAISSQ